MSINRVLTAGAFIAAAIVATGAEATDVNNTGPSTNSYLSNLTHVPAPERAKSAAIVEPIVMNSNNNAYASASASANVTQIKTLVHVFPPTYTKNAIAQCPASLVADAFGMTPKSTPFAQQFWSRVQCGLTENARAMADIAPKADPIDLVLHKKSAALVKCYNDSFPKDNQTAVTIGRRIEFLTIDMYDDVGDAQKVNGAMAHACKQQLKM